MRLAGHWRRVSYISCARRVSLAYAAHSRAAFGRPDSLKFVPVSRGSSRRPSLLGNSSFRFYVHCGNQTALALLRACTYALSSSCTERYVPLFLA